MTSLVDSQPHGTARTRVKANSSTVRTIRSIVGNRYASAYDPHVPHKSLRSCATRKKVSQPSRLAINRSKPLSYPEPDLTPPDCAPEAVDNLWQIVRQKNSMQPQLPFQRATAASKNKSKDRYETGFPAPPTSADPSITSANRPLSTAPSTVPPSSVKSKPHRVTDNNFRSEILHRYGVTIRTKHDMRNPYEHFNTEAPNADPEETEYEAKISLWYKQKHNHKDCDIWLALDKLRAEEVAKQYQILDTLHENEAKFSFKGKTYFFKEDNLVSPHEPGRYSSTYFKLEWGPKPEGKLLQCPPQVIGPLTTGSQFGFTTNPDCTYWLTLCRMNPTYRNLVSSLTYVLPHAKATAPYLTIEFKKDGLSFEAAENQLAVSTALILYNRFRLRCDRLKACAVRPTAWKQGDFDDIKHYGIAFNGSEASFYVAQPSLLFDKSASVVEEDIQGDIAHDIWEPESLWRGCTLSRFNVLDARLGDQVLEIQRWVNEIHNWGLTEYSRQFVLDIKGLLFREPGGNRVSISKEEMAAFGLEV